MRAAILDKGKITVGDMPDPEPGERQVLVRTRRCALCASDNHFMCSGHEIVRQSQQFGGPYATIDLDRPIVMGHEYVGEIVDYGPGSGRPLKPGTRVTSIPAMLRADGVGIIGYQNELPGGFGEYMLLDEAFLMPVPEHMPDEHAALIEPLAVGLEHARVGEPKASDIPLVLGCGAIGLGVIAGLKLAGVHAIVAADFDPGRRALALKMGAAVAVDPRETSPYEAVPGIGRPNLVYECVGKAGVLGDIVAGVGEGARIVMGGYSLEPERFYVPPAQNKKLKIFFARGEEWEDMQLAMDAIADGRVDITPWLGETIGLDGVAKALAGMRDPSKPVRTVVDPTA